MQPSTVVILGSTGSIGTQGLDVISRHLDRFTVTGLAAGGAHVELLAQQAAKFHVPTVAIFYKEAVPALREALEQAGAGNVNITAGPDAVIAMAGSGADVVLNGITGSIGLEPSIAALQAGSQLALANKDPWWPADTCCLARRLRDKQINPVDSEHSAIWQSLAFRHARRSVQARRHRVRRSVPRLEARPNDRHHAGTGLEPPHMEHGAGRDHQLVHADEQRS